MASTEEIRGFINGAKGQFFSGVYIKKDGSLRKFLGKEFKASAIVGGVSTLAEDQIAYYDMNAKGWRSFKSGQLRELTIGTEKVIDELKQD